MNRRIINLDNDLGYLIIDLPAEFDTTYSWINRSDYYCGARKMVKLANKDYSLLKTSFFAEAADSLFEINISQSAHPDCGDETVKIDAEILNQRIRMRKAEYLSPFDRIEIDKIKGRDYLVTHDATKSQGMDYTSIKAETVVDGNLITIEFNCYAKNCGDFSIKMESVLSTVQIRTTKDD